MSFQEEMLKRAELKYFGCYLLDNSGPGKRTLVAAGQKRSFASAQDDASGPLCIAILSVAKDLYHQFL